MYGSQKKSGNRAFTDMVEKAVVLVVLVALSAVIVAVGYDTEWTDIGEISVHNPKVAPGKTLWDWLELLIVPIVLALGTLFFEARWKAAAERQEVGRQRQGVLEGFMTYVSQMVVPVREYGLDERDRVSSMIRSRALSAVRQLDPERKTQLLQFLSEAGLLKRVEERGSKDFFISLIGADLSYLDLDGAALVDSELRGALFEGTTFRHAQLLGADLRGSVFRNADFSQANLDGADLHQAVLSRVRVAGASFNRSRLEDVLVEDTWFSTEQIKSMEKFAPCGGQT